MDVRARGLPRDGPSQATGRDEGTLGGVPALSLLVLNAERRQDLRHAAAAGINDVHDVWLEGGAPHEEPVQVLQRRHFAAVAGVHRARVEEARRVGHFLAHVVPQPVPHERQGLLHLLVGGEDARVARPQGLEGKDHAGPVADGAGEGLQLLEQHLLRASFLAVLGCLAQTRDYLEVIYIRLYNSCIRNLTITCKYNIALKLYSTIQKDLQAITFIPASCA